MSYPKRFTLVELLVVIAIVMILAGLLLPVMKRSLAQARMIACMGNLRQLGIAQNVYAADSRMFCPAAQYGDTTYYRHAWWNRMAPSFALGGTPSSYSVAQWKQFFRSSILWCPSRTEEDWNGTGKYQCGYAANSFAHTPGLAQISAFKQVYLTGSNNVYGLVASASLPPACPPSRLLLMADVNYEDSGSQIGFTSPIFSGYTQWDPNPFQNRNNVAYRHDKKGGVLFADGHCRMLWASYLTTSLLAAE